MQYDFHSLMVNDTSKSIVEEIRKNLKNRGITQAKLAELSGLQPGHLSELLSNKKRFNSDIIDKIAKGFGISAKELLSSKGPKAVARPALYGIRILGEVQAGTWKEALQWDDDDAEQILMPLGKFANSNAYALTVKGDSMNLVYHEGAILAVVPLAEFTSALTTGNRVIVQRTKRDGIIEATAKELIINDGKAELWPRSTNPKFQTPINIFWPYSDPQGSDTEMVEIIGVIVGSYLPERV